MVHSFVHLTPYDRLGFVGISASTNEIHMMWSERIGNHRYVNRSGKL